MVSEEQVLPMKTLELLTTDGVRLFAATILLMRLVIEREVVSDKYPMEFPFEC